MFNQCVSNTRRHWTKIHTKKILDCFDKDDGNKLTFRTPAIEGPYRIFVFIYDQKGNFATTNTPFYVLNNK